MHHAAAIAASLASLGLVCSIYYCNILSRPGSWFRGNTLAMFLLSMLVGLFPLAVAAALMGLWTVLAKGLGVTAILSAGVDLVSIGAVVATVVVFRALVRATYRMVEEPMNVSPNTPPVAPAVFASLPPRPVV